MKNILVSDVMTRDPILVDPKTNLLECSKTLVKKKISSLLLVDKKRLVGILSMKDILWALVKKSQNDLSKIKAIDISPRKIATIKPNANIDEALSKMKKLKFRKLPVIQNKELVGLITIKDILNFHPELYPELEEFSQIREQSKKLQRVKKAKTKVLNEEGICEECGAVDILYKVDGRVLCEECRNSM